MNKTPYVEAAEPAAPLPYGSIGREFFLGSRMKNAEKLCALLRDSVEIMDKLSERGWAIRGQRAVNIAGLKAARAWAQYFNESNFAAHMHENLQKRTCWWWRPKRRKTSTSALTSLPGECATCPGR